MKNGKRDLKFWSSTCFYRDNNMYFFKFFLNWEKKFNNNFFLIDFRNIRKCDIRKIFWEHYRKIVLLKIPIFLYLFYRKIFIYPWNKKIPNSFLNFLVHSQYSNHNQCEYININESWFDSRKKFKFLLLYLNDGAQYVQNEFRIDFV